MTDRNVKAMKAKFFSFTRFVARVLGRTRRHQNPDPAEFYGTSRGQRLVYGVSVVSIPKDHRIGTLETHSVWSVLKLEFKADPEKHVILHRVSAMARDEFFDHLKQKVQQSENKAAVVFVHGFNVSFEDAVRRTAQIAYDLRFEGAPICYSWPSKARLSLAGYRHDATNVKWTSIHLKQFLEDLAASSGASSIHLIAHSMGNQALTDALEAIASEMTEQHRPAFNEVILTAPDIDAGVFEELAERFHIAARRVTLYASSNDKALIFSKIYNGDYPRAGDTAASITVVRGIDTIDVSAVDTNLIGHFYYGDNDSVLSDLFYVINEGMPPSDRYRLKPKSKNGNPYWVFRP